MTLIALASTALLLFAPTGAPPDGDGAQDGAPVVEAASQPAASQPATAQPAAPPPSTFDSDADDAEPTDLPPPMPDDPFFSSDLDGAFDNVDTEWQNEQEIEQSTKAFVGPPSPFATYKSLVKHEEISLTLRTRVLASVQELRDTRDDGFELRQLRATVSGQLGDLSYFSQVEAAQAPALVDAYVTYLPVAALGLSVGRMKMPFSREFLISRPDLTFIDRAEIVLAAAPTRSTGAMLLGGFFDQRLRYQLGAYQSGGLDELEWGRRLLYVGRVSGTPLRLDALGRRWAVELGVNAAYADQEQLDLSSITPLAELGVIDGRRILAGADLHLQLGPAWLTAEGIYGRYQRLDEPAENAPWVAGGFAEAGAELVRDVVGVMLRYDALYAAHRDRYNQFVIVGTRVDPTEFFRIQLNYAWGTGGASFWSRNQVIACFQLTL